MKKNYGSLLLRNLVGFTLVVTLVLTSSMVSLASTGNALSGEIIVSGQRIDGAAPAVSLNGETILTGRTFFNSAVIATPDNASATVNLGKLGRVIISPNTSLSLALAENSISGDIASGQVQVLNAEGVSVNLRGNNDVITNDASIAGDVSVDMTSGKAVASSTAGGVFVNGKAAAAEWKKREWTIFGAVVAVVVGTAVVIYFVTRDDEVTSPAR